MSTRGADISQSKTGIAADRCIKARCRGFLGHTPDVEAKFWWIAGVAIFVCLDSPANWTESKP